MADADHACRLAERSDSERLLVDTFRRWLAGGEFRASLPRRLAHDIEPEAIRPLLDGLEATIHVLATYACRNIAYHHPCCPMLGGDEAALLDLIAAAQWGDPIRQRAAAAYFVAQDGLPALLAASRLAGTALRRGDVALPMRRGSADILGSPASGPTLH